MAVPAIRQYGTRVIGHIACASAKFLSNTEAPLHHIATNKHTTKWTKEFADLFSKGGLDLNYWANKLRVPGHKGPHKDEYHQSVLDHLQGKIDSLDLRGLAGDVAQELIAEAITEGLLEIAEKVCDKRTRWYKLVTGG